MLDSDTYWSYRIKMGPQHECLSPVSVAASVKYETAYKTIQSEKSKTQTFYKQLLIMIHSF